MYPLPDQMPPWGVSTVPNPITGLVANPMGQVEIDEVIEAFAAAARRCQQGGIDGVEIHAAHSYLIMQFLSPLVNHRTDQYGGPLENRMRFLRQVLEAIRQVVSDDYPVGIRVGASTAEGGIGEIELAQVIQILEADGLLDFVDVSWTDYYEFKFVAAMDQPMGYQLPHASKLTAAATKVPRMVIGRFRTLDEVELVLRDGIADMVHMTRAHIADPDIVRKTRAGHPERVRACIGCNQACWHGTNTGWPLACTINPVTGLEGTLNEDLIAPSDRPGHVLVVGGGPAGMEAARISRLRGHRVTLVEAGSDLGGSWRWRSVLRACTRSATSLSGSSRRFTGWAWRCERAPISMSMTRWQNTLTMWSLRLERFRAETAFSMNIRMRRWTAMTSHT